MATTRVLPINIVQEAQKPIKIVKLWLRRTAYIILVSILIYVLSVWIFHRFVDTKSVKNGNDSDIVAETTVRQDTDVRTIKIVAHPDKWVKVNIPSGCDWQFDSNPAYGLENTKTLVAVRINGDERTIKRSGMLQDGSISNTFFQIQASCVEFKSEDKNPAYLLVHLTKK